MPSTMLGNYYLPSQLNTVDMYKSYLQKRTVTVSYTTYPVIGRKTWVFVKTFCKAWSAMHV